MKACIDTNVWLSGIVFTGAPAEIVQLAFKQKFQVVTSDFILDEVERNLVKKFDVPARKAKNLIYRISQIADVYQPNGTVTLLPNRNPDNFVLETAWIGRAKYLVTGDRGHLLPLNGFRNIKIVNPTAFLAAIKR
ncbi:MAG: putative toxin-antitoxin system toxin component, PIN family [Bdellovibrionales bacterium]|nr:putative toxin-antitoxin system toxin component, PIN family [Bdellovibrionales bacterium]